MTKIYLNLILLTLLSLGFSTLAFPLNTNATVTFTVDRSDTKMKRIYLEETNNYFLFTPFLSREVGVDSNLNLIFEINKPKLFKFTCLNPQTSSLFIYVTPGDDVIYKLDDFNSLVFEGKNAAHYNFFTKLNAIKLKYPIYSENNDVWKYKNMVELYYLKQIEFFEKYCSEEDVSEDFIAKIQEVLKFQMINMLLNRNLIPITSIIEKSKYLGAINTTTFKVENPEDNNYFYLALMNFLFFSTTTSVKIPFSNEQLKEQLALIDANFNSTVYDYAITKTFAEYIDNLSTENVNETNAKLYFYIDKVEDENYKKVLEQFAERLSKMKSSLPKNVLESKLIDVNGREFTLQEILKEKNNTIKVFDFWASWCAPCIAEIKKSYNFRTKLSANSEVEFMYFSVDKDVEKWKEKVKRLNDFGMSKNQYLIIDYTSSSLSNYFDISAIPQYVILNKANTRYFKNIPTPSESLEFMNFIEKFSAEK